MILNPKDMRTAPFVLISYGSYEKFESYLLHTISKKVKSFVDVGANIGFYTISVAKINQKCIIYSFEPNLNIFSELKENISLNHLGSKIHLFNVGLGDRKDCTEEFFVPKFTGTGGGSLKNLHPEEGVPEKISIQLTTLDSALKGKQVDLIKIDVEGNEFDVITGSMKMISNSKPIIFIELLRKWMKAFNHHPQEILEILGKVGYSCFGIKESWLTAVSKIDENTLENNFIFCHKNDLKTSKFLEGFVDEE
jgi:FkbM family methyltransferase